VGEKTAFTRTPGSLQLSLLPTGCRDFTGRNENMLSNYPRTIVTKDGLSLQLRPVTRSDEAALRKLFSEIPQDEKWFLRDNLEDPEILHRWLENLDFDRSLPVVAVKSDTGEIVALLRLHCSASGCARHVAHLRVMVHPGYRAQKVGSWLILDCAKLAVNRGIEKLIAEFVAGVEDVALGAAHRLDFHQEAILKEYVKDRQGNYRDLIVMSKTLSREWGDF
jgi:L-amino acid N-acyltransferase YncA